MNKNPADQTSAQKTPNSERRLSPSPLDSQKSERYVNQLKAKLRAVTLDLNKAYYQTAAQSPPNLVKYQGRYYYTNGRN